jgi:hypothetical protein
VPRAASAGDAAFAYGRAHFAEWFRASASTKKLNMYLGTVSGADVPELMYSPPLNNLAVKDVC